MKDGENISQLAIPLNASITDKDCTIFTSTLWLFMLWNNFFLDAATYQKERETILVEPVSSLKIVFNLKHLSCKQFHRSVKGDSTFLRNSRNL